MPATACGCAAANSMAAAPPRLAPARTTGSPCISSLQNEYRASRLASAEKPPLTYCPSRSEKPHPSIWSQTLEWQQRQSVASQLQISS
eukprot:scaffold2522_cov242-Pinguiococcus_pyrenoidosus.AAC.11